MKIYRCCTCNVRKTRDNFYADRTKKDGVGVNRCKRCEVEVGKTVKYRLRHLKSSLKFAYKEKARGAVHRAVKLGLIIKPKSCTSCNFPANRIEGHHADYSIPLAVRWLCPPCHKYEHQKTPAPRKGA